VVGSEPGRWREDPKDDKLLFEVVERQGALHSLKIMARLRPTELFEREQIQDFAFSGAARPMTDRAFDPGWLPLAQRRVVGDVQGWRAH